MSTIHAPPGYCEAIEDASTEAGGRDGNAWNIAFREALGTRGYVIRDEPTPLENGYPPEMAPLALPGEAGWPKRSFIVDA